LEQESSDVGEGRESAELLESEEKEMMY